MQHIVTTAIALYPRLNQPYRFDNQEQRSVPCAYMELGAGYDITFEVERDQASTLKKLCLEAYANAAAADTKRRWPEQPRFLPIKMVANEDGSSKFVGKAKLRAMYGTEKTQPPKQVDAQRNKLPDDFRLTTGSIVNVAVTIVPFMSGPDNYGVSLRLRAVQVLSLSEGAQEDPFTATTGFVAGQAPAAPAAKSAAYADPFGVPETGKVTAKQVAAAFSPTPAQPAPAFDMDDEIPF